MVESKPIVHIIDDDFSVGKALGRLLKSMDYEYKAFESAEDFLQSNAVDKAGCLILDIQLPGMKGTELRRT